MNLKNTAKTKGQLKGLQTLEHLAEMFGIEEADVHIKAEKVADAVLADLYKPEYIQMDLTEKVAYAPRVKSWK